LAAKKKKQQASWALYLFIISVFIYLIQSRGFGSLKWARPHTKTNTNTRWETGGAVCGRSDTFIYCILYLFINAYLLFMQQVINYSLDFLVFRSAFAVCKMFTNCFWRVPPTRKSGSCGKAGAVGKVAPSSGFSS